MNIPTFSWFSAVSELFVTAIVLYAIIGNIRGKPFRWKLLGLALLFELTVNVMYMIQRAAVADTDSNLAGGLKLMFALHGILSLVMFVALLLLYLIATFEHKAGHATWFQRHPVGAWTFVAFWLLAVGSGEAAFIWRYFPTA